MNIETEQTVQFLRLALEEAKTRRGFCAPNPAVGAVLVKDDRVIATGKHWAAGCPHAEVDALRKAENDAAGATLFVTLEPCCHVGKTPACTEAIIRAGVSRVVFSQQDPNPLVAGKGMKTLQQAGIVCCQYEWPEITEFYRSYVFWTQHHRPWVTLKLAISADEKIAGENGRPIQITGDACQRFTHQHRLESDGLLTTIETIIQDDPQLNVRLDNEMIAKSVYVLDSHLRLPLDAAIFRTAKEITVYHREDCDAAGIHRLQQQGVRCVAVDFNAVGLNLKTVLDDLGEQGIHDLWVEAGARCFQSFYEQQLANRVLIFRSQKILGSAAIPAFPHSSHPFLNRQCDWQSMGVDEILRLTMPG